MSRSECTSHGRMLPRVTPRPNIQVETILSKPIPPLPPKEEPMTELYDNESANGLADWWQATVDNDVHKTVPKIQEYGTQDLAAIGQMITALEGRRLTDTRAAMLGCLFYATGKTTRAMSALIRNVDPSEDTLFDLAVYAMMARSYAERGEL